MGAVCPGKLPWGRAAGSGASPAPQLLQTGSTCRGAQTCWGTPAGLYIPSPPPASAPGTAPAPQAKGPGTAAPRVLLTRGWERLPLPARYRLWGARVWPCHPFTQRARHNTALCPDSPRVPARRSTALLGRSRDTHGRDSRYRLSMAGLCRTEPSRRSDTESAPPTLPKLGRARGHGDAVRDTGMRCGTRGPAERVRVAGHTEL